MAPCQNSLVKGLKGGAGGGRARVEKERGGWEGKGEFSFHELGATWWWQGLGARPIGAMVSFALNVPINRG